MQIDHGRTNVHDMRHNLLGQNHEVSVPSKSSTATFDRLSRDGYGYRSGWIDQDGKHGPAGQRWLLFTRRENTDGTITSPIAF